METLQLELRAEEDQLPKEPQAVTAESVALDAARKLRAAAYAHNATVNVKPAKSAYFA